MRVPRDPHPLPDDLRRRAVDVRGRRVSYVTAGDEAAPALLLIHGSGMSGSCWINQVHGLRHAARVMAVDLPGHGESASLEEASVETYAETVADFLDAEGTGPVVVAGHSLGGAVALDLAARRPQRVRGLVLLSTCARLPRANLAWEGWMAWLPRSLRALLFFSMARKALFVPEANPHAVSLGMHELRSCRSDTLLSDLRAATAMDLTRQARLVAVPALVVCGSRDALIPPRLSRQLADLIPGARLAIIDGAGHMAQLEMPDAVNRALLDVVTTVGAPLAGARRGRSLVGRLADWMRKAMRFPGRAEEPA